MNARASRIGRTPELTVRPNAPLFAPLGIVDGRWRCALCEQDLGDEHDNWRAAAITSEHEISERYEQLHSKVRPRVQAEPVVIRMSPMAHARTRSRLRRSRRRTSRACSRMAR